MLLLPLKKFIMLQHGWSDKPLFVSQCSLSPSRNCVLLMRMLHLSKHNHYYFAARLKEYVWLATECHIFFSHPSKHLPCFRFCRRIYNHIMRYYLEISACNLKETQLSQNFITVVQKSYMLQQTLTVMLKSLKQVSKK